MESETAALTIIAIGYLTPCTVPGCVNLARAILRHVDRGGRPLSNLERCNRHTREAIEAASESGLAVDDQRKPSQLRK